MLLAAKALSADPNAPNVMNHLATAARAVTDAINMLLNLCSSSGPGQKECDNALRNIEVGYMYAVPVHCGQCNGMKYGVGRVYAKLCIITGGGF